MQTGTIVNFKNSRHTGLIKSDEGDRYAIFSFRKPVPLNTRLTGSLDAKGPQVLQSEDGSYTLEAHGSTGWVSRAMAMRLL